MKRQQGFTLIELIVVIVILGILAATALPRFVSFQGDAAQAAVQGVAGAVTSASTINYSTFQISSARATALNGATACNTLITSTRTGLVGGNLPTGYNIATGGEADCSSAASGDTRSCTITTTQGSATVTATATIICTGA
ncbi:Fimbrial protein [Rhodocyclaceae bacterium]|nr:Fimbrial protein [Rhodocyclaceae bacterium]